MEFKEEQKFTQWWIWAILITLGTLPAIGVYQQLILKQPFGDKPMSNLGLLVFTVIVYGLIGFFVSLKLKTIVDNTGIAFHFSPFVKKKVSWVDIKSAAVLNYGFVGGWGIRYWTRYGTVYNIKGKMGLAIELKNGVKFLIGTQKHDELHKVIQFFSNPA